MLTKIEAFDVRIPLKYPYHTAIAELDNFALTVVLLEDDQGRCGYGETAAVKGYSWESPEDTWNFALQHGPSLPGQDPAAAFVRLSSEQAKWPFGVTPFLTAIEVLVDEPLLKNPPQRVAVPLVGLVNAVTAAEVPTKLELVLADGYRILKFKCGFAVEDDINRTLALQKAVAGRAKIRIDANQGYNFDDAVKFVRSIDPAGIELFEQPFADDNWEAMNELARISPLPLMLDESIYHLEEVERTARDKCAQFIKFKLMKGGSAQNTASYIRRAQDLGITAVIGNGVASDIGCYHEALIHVNAGITCAGEENGFLKPKELLFTQSLEFADGCIWLEPHFQPQIDRAKLQKYSARTSIWQI